MKKLLVLCLLFSSATQTYAEITTQVANNYNDISKNIIKNYVYNGSEYSMLNDSNHLFVGNAIDKTINVISVFNSDITPTWAKFRNLSRAFGY